MVRNLQPAPSLIPTALLLPRGEKPQPGDMKFRQRWLSNLIEHVETNPKTLYPVITDFQALIENDPFLFMLFQEMFTQNNPAVLHSDLFESPQVTDYKHMLRTINEILTRAPTFEDTSCLGIPLASILNGPSMTPSGIIAFANEKVNAQLKRMLNVWSNFLSSPASTYVLNDSLSGWLGPDALTAMATATEPTQQNWKFEFSFICDPTAPHYGFKSWDDFFTRSFRPGMRPIANPEDPHVITCPCESLPIRLRRNVRAYERFWVKEQPYSLYHMLAHDPLAEQFVGGTIYQGLLLPTNYHRWHAPVSGRIIKSYVQPGSYFAQGSFLDLFHPAAKATQGNNPWLGCLTSVATRGIIFIEADSPTIGLICVLPIGLAEIGTCDIRVREGQWVKKGDELGMFHYGGSTFCMIFRKGVDLTWDSRVHGGMHQNTSVRVNGKIAKVVTYRE